MLLSIVIVNWNTKNQLRDCLESINKEKGDLDVEIFVIDNNSSDGSAKMIKNNFPNINLIANQENIGFARANNQGIRESKGVFVLLLNPDTIMLPGTLINAISYFENNDNAGIIGCKLLNPDRSIQPSCRTFPSLLSQIFIMLKLHHVFINTKSLKKYYMTDFDYMESREVDQVMGAFFMIKRKVINKVGFIDEIFWLWFEEVDYCYQTRKAGFKIYFTKDAEIIHRKAESFNQMLAPKKQIAMNNSLIHYFKKNGNIFDVIMILFCYPLSIVLSFIIYGIEKLKGPIKRNKNI